MRENKKLVLIVDDDPKIRKVLTFILGDEKFKFIECETGKSAILLSVSAKPDLILLDLGLPDMDGRDVITALRDWCEAPIIVISARSTNQDVSTHLNHGADDYITKPFNSDVLQARINVALRRFAIREAGKPELVNGFLRMDLVRHKVFLNDQLVVLTPKEFSLLRFFITNCGKMLGHREILQEVWGAAHSDSTQYLRVYVRQLRDKIEKNPAMPAIITTETGIGYRMELIDNWQHKQGELRI